MRLQFQRFQVGAEIFAQLLVLQGEFHGGFQEAEFVASVVRDAFVDVSPQTLLLRESAHPIGELDFVTRAGFGAFEAIKDCRGQDVTAGRLYGRLLALPAINEFGGIVTLAGVGTFVFRLGSIAVGKPGLCFGTATVDAWLMRVVSAD